MILINKETNEVILENLQIADCFFKRLKGLMFKKEIQEKDGLQIKPCNQIHTFFMKFSIDVLYLDKSNKIIYIDEDFNPGKIGKFVKGGKSVIELQSGKIKELDIKVGEIVEVGGVLQNK